MYSSSLEYKVASQYLMKLGMEFPTQKALEKYLNQHPKADKSRHKVVENKKPKNKSSEEFFSRDEFQLPEEVTQPTKNPDKLFEDAKVAHEQQLDWLNRGRGLDRAIGAKVIRGDKGEKNPSALETPGPVIMIGPIKSRKRAEEKVKAWYLDWDQLGDIVRSSIAVDNMDQIHEVMDILRKSGLKLARRPKDRFASPAPGDYRDLMINVTYPNGHVGELQIHLKSMLQAKNEDGHKIYNRVRPILEKAEKEGRDFLSEEESEVLIKGMEDMRRVYNEAYRRSQNSRSKRSSDTFVKSNAKTQYFEMDGIPIYWEKNKLPKAVRKGGKEIVLYDLFKVIHEATSISDAQFDKMVASLKKS